MARDIAEIRRDIEESRARLRDTAEAIGWKADVPARARDILRETAGVVRERVAQGHSAGAGNGSGHSGSSGPGLLERAKSAMSGVTEGVSSATHTVADKAGSAKDSVSSTASTVGDKVGSAKDSVASTTSTVGEKVGSAKESVASTASTMGDKMSSARESVSSGAGSASETAGSAVGTVKEHMPTTDDARQGVQRVAGVAKANPMALAIGALVLGAAAGIALPKTRVEEEKVAPVAENLREQGVEKATQAIQQGREVITEKASQVAEQGQQAVQQVTEQARERVSETADRAATAGTSEGDSSPEGDSSAETVRAAGEPTRAVS
jgi:hypothetical protein